MLRCKFYIKLRLLLEEVHQKISCYQFLWIQSTKCLGSCICMNKVCTMVYLILTETFSFFFKFIFLYHFLLESKGNSNCILRYSRMNYPNELSNFISRRNIRCSQKFLTRVGEIVEHLGTNNLRLH